MGLNLEQKQSVVAEVAKQVAGAQAIILVENRGMKVADMTQLRAKARASGVYFRVVKNTLVRRAVESSPFAPLSGRMVGPLAYGIGPDPVAVAKVLSEFAKTNEKFVLVGGSLGSQTLDANGIKALAELPAQAVLPRAKFGDAAWLLQQFCDGVLAPLPRDFDRKPARLADL